MSSSNPTYHASRVNQGAATAKNRGHSVDVLNNAVDMPKDLVSPRNALAKIAGATSPKNPKSHQGHASHVREHSVRVQRIPGSNLNAEVSIGDQPLDSLSVNGKVAQGNGRGPLSTTNGQPLEVIKKTNLISIDTTADSKSVSGTSPNSPGEGSVTPSITGANTADAQQAGEQYKLKDIQLDLNNLAKVDEKLVALSDALKKNNIGVISQLCSDWWEVTDEDDYAVAKF